MPKYLVTVNTYERKPQQNHTNPSRSPQHRSPQLQGAPINHSVPLGFTDVVLNTNVQTSLQEPPVSREIVPSALYKQISQRDMIFQKSHEATSQYFSFRLSLSVANNSFAQNIAGEGENITVEGSMESSLMPCLEQEQVFLAGWEDLFPGLLNTSEHRMLPNTLALEDSNFLQDNPEKRLLSEYFRLEYEEVPEHICEIFIKILGDKVTAIQRRCYLILLRATELVSDKELIKKLNLSNAGYVIIPTAKNKLLALGAIERLNYPYISKDAEVIRRFAGACIDEERGNPRFLVVELISVDDEKMNIILGWLKKEIKLERRKKIFLYMAHNRLVPRGYLVANFFNNMKKGVRESLISSYINTMNKLGGTIDQDIEAIEAIQELYLECFTPETVNPILWVLKFADINDKIEECIVLWLENEKRDENMKKIFLCMATNTLVAKGYIRKNFYNKSDSIVNYNENKFNSLILSINSIREDDPLIKQKKISFGKRDKSDRNSYTLLYVLDCRLTKDQLSNLYDAASLPRGSLAYTKSTGAFHSYSARKEGGNTIINLSDCRQGSSELPFFKISYENAVIKKSASYYASRCRTESYDNTDNSSVMQDFPSQSSSSTLTFSQDPIDFEIPRTLPKRCISTEDADDQLQSKKPKALLEGLQT